MCKDGVDTQIIIDRISGQTHSCGQFCRCKAFCLVQLCCSGASTRTVERWRLSTTLGAAPLIEIYLSALIK